MPPIPSPNRLAAARAAVRDLRDFVVSLKLTIVLLLFSMVLVFAATIDQVNLGIWAVQEKYFHSFVVYTQVGPFALPVFPGGYAVGGLLLINLIAAHVYRFAFTWRKAGIQLVHAGLIILLVGELLSGLLQQDAHMTLTEGETKNYAESSREHELVLVDTSDATTDQVTAIPEALLARKGSIHHPKLPFRIEVKSYFPNSMLASRPADGSAAIGDQASTGIGSHVTAVPQPVTHRPNERNVPAAIVEIVGADGSLGTWLASPELPMPQEFKHDTRTWRIALRVRRTYQPFSLTLLKFSHDRYAGTDIPKNFSSRLRLTTPDGRENREVLVYMNNPLRYEGVTFYQAGFQNDDRTTILQVVRNPAWSLPYVACTMMTLGLTWQFGFHLIGFIRKRQVASTAPSASPTTNKPAAKRPALPQVA